MPLLGYKPDKIAIEIAKKSCLVCVNYHAVHPHTKLCYCDVGKRQVFTDSGCSDWQKVNLIENGKTNEQSTNP